MTLANWCVLAACLLPVITVGLAKADSAKLKPEEGGYDNREPRLWAQQLEGWRQRANAAQQNGWEALPLFIAAVVLAQQAHADQGRIDMLAMTFIGLRLIYIATYLANMSNLRSLVWTAGVAVNVAILFMS